MNVVFYPHPYHLQYSPLFWLRHKFLLSDFHLIPLFNVAYNSFLLARLCFYSLHKECVSLSLLSGYVFWLQDSRLGVSRALTGFLYLLGHHPFIIFILRLDVFKMLSLYFQCFYWWLYMSSFTFFLPFLLPSHFCLRFLVLFWLLFPCWINY